MSKIFNTLLLAIFIAVVIFISHWIGEQAYSWMPVQATAEAKKVDDLFSFLVALGAFIFLGIVGLIIYSIITCRASKDDFSDGVPMQGNIKLEILWTVVPIALVIWIAGQSYYIYQQINIQGLTPLVHLHLPTETEPAYAENKPSSNEETKPIAEEIDITAKQWSWNFRYPSRNVVSDELHLPVNQNVRLVMHSEDVIHGFYIPEFRIKQDIVPNRKITFAFAPITIGKYRLRDSQFSGTYFALMEADVYVDSLADYNKWLDQAATRPINQSSNPALSEHTQRNRQGFNSGWPTVIPNQTFDVKNQNNDK